MTVKFTDGNIHMFGEGDYTKEGKPASEFPSWYFDGAHIQELEDRVSQMDTQLKMGVIPESEIPLMRNRLKEHRERLEIIKQSKPRLSEAQENKLLKCYREIGSQISNAMFTRDEVMRGTASPHKEADRMSTNCLEIPREHAEIFAACNVTGKTCSRKQMEKVWKIAGRYFGEPSNTEHLRRQSGTTANG